MLARDLPLLAALLVALLGAVLVAPPIATRGEAREGLVVRELVAGGDWVLPRRQGVIASKPPLYHWLATGAVRALGWSDTAVRLPSALAAWAVALETFAIGLLVGGRVTAWLAVGIVFATWGFWHSATEARVDMLFAAAVTGAIASFAWWELRGLRCGRMLCWLAAAAAVLTKGPAGFVLPALVVLAFLLSGRDAGRLRALWSWPAAAASLLVAGGWYAAATLSGGRDFLAVQVMKENVDRFAGRGEFAPNRALSLLAVPGWFLGHLLPWNLAIIADVRRWWRGERETAVGRLLHCWWLAVLGVFTLSAGKRSVYLLPLYPAIALLAARALARRVRGRGARLALAAALVTASLALLVMSHRERVAERERHALPPLARATAALVPRDAPLHASLGLPENDRLVFAYLLDRPLERRRVTCELGDARASYLRPIPSRAAATRLETLASFGGTELVRCPAG